MSGAGMTPGEWEIRAIPRDDDPLPDVVVGVFPDAPGAAAVHVARVYGHGGTMETDPEMRANGCAIAAVPEMVKALDRIAGQAYDAGQYGETEANARLAEVLVLARAALSRARGEEGGKDA